MTPVDFVVFDGDSNPNLPVHVVAEAMTKPLIILASDGEYEVLSYYISNNDQGGCMVLDIQKLEKN